MTWEITWGAGLEDVLVTSHGTASVEGLDAVIREVMADSRFHPGLSIVFDESDLEWGAMDATDLRRRVQLFPGYLADAGDVRVAVVTGGPVGHGVHRQMESLSGGFTFDFAIVSSLEDARAWLRREG